MQILVYGYGNPGRQDDGLGNELVRRLEEWVIAEGIVDIAFDSNYQLNIEDADAIAQNELVIFVDASEEDIEDFCLSSVDGKGKLAFTTHAASPSYIVKLCQELFQKTPRVFLLHIKGYEWAFQEGLSSRADENLAKALDFMKKMLENPEGAAKSTGKEC
ncbi:MAG: Ni/Fe hydrogenase [Chloroflexota bacterium]|nr:MAG: Ni/Fe hydrogenase [Chloroflexota bacterium]HDD62225.1 hydrogenase maturation protease [Chloroflexota bacterium]